MIQCLFFNFIFKLYNIVLVLPNIKMNPPQVYMCSPSWTLLPPPSPYHPSGSSQCTSPKHPVSCIEPGLATHFIYDIICISMPFSQIIPPSPSPTESKRLFYTSVSLLLSRIQGYFVWYYYGHSCSLLVTICMECLFPSFPFYPIYADTWVWAGRQRWAEWMKTQAQLYVVLQMKPQNKQAKRGRMEKDIPCK